MKKLSTLFLAVVASVGTIFAESGTCGENLTWNLTNGVLTIFGTGAMYDYDSSLSPWYDQRESITSLIINNGVTHIGQMAFHSCTNLPSVTIPNSVTSIGNLAFYKCTNLTAVYITDLAVWCNIEFEGLESNPLLFAHNLYLNGDLVVDLVVPSGVTSIGNYAFVYCSGLTSVTIPNSVTSIGNQAFSSCTGLTSIEIPSSVTSIDNWVLYGCVNLTSIIASANVLDIDEEEDWYRFTRSLQSVTFTSGELNYYVLGLLARSYKSLTSIDISGVSNTELDDEAFKGFYNLQSLVLPANLTKIGYMAVADCKNLQSINIPASVTEISQSAFENCRSLKTITFGGQASSVPELHNAPATSASQLQTIGNWAFYNCHELQNLTIPEGVTSIGDGAFYGCVYLEDLSLPASVQSIGDNTFALCSKLKKITVNAPVPPSIQAKTFYDVKRQIPVYVPDESVNAYRNDAQWSEFDIRGISNMPQGLNQITNDQLPTTHKVFRNSQILILRGDRTYTLTGAEVK